MPRGLELSTRLFGSHRREAEPDRPAELALHATIGLARGADAWARGTARGTLTLDGLLEDAPVTGPLTLRRGELRLELGVEGARPALRLDAAMHLGARDRWAGLTTLGGRLVDGRGEVVTRLLLRLDLRSRLGAMLAGLRVVPMAPPGGPDR